ncbi:MAG: NYN domain-containing protein [Thermosynechococcaceae cyanobacterium MS004]|nr:NYN domain-containing protein [Thermosynechococcaceae cyanobacterium MS004]
MASPDATLLVDGYNVIGIWKPLALRRDRQHLEAARDALIGELASYSAFQGYQTRIIFDAHLRRESSGNAEVITETLEAYYTEYGETADSHIELFCAQARSQSHISRVIVATSDRAQQLTVTGYGAEWMSAHQLIQEIKAATLQMHQAQRAKQKRNARFLSHSLDPAAKVQLEKWRYGID